MIVALITELDAPETNIKIINTTIEIKYVFLFPKKRWNKNCTPIKENALNPQIMKINKERLKCKTFYEKGYCPLGSKCKFQHEERKFTNFSYFYIRLFLLKNFGFPCSKFNYDEKNSNLYNKRLEVFQSLTDNSNNCEKNDEIEKYDSSCDNFENADIIIDFN